MNYPKEKTKTYLSLCLEPPAKTWVFAFSRRNRANKYLRVTPERVDFAPSWTSLQQATNDCGKTGKNNRAQYGTFNQTAEVQDKGTITTA